MTLNPFLSLTDAHGDGDDEFWDQVIITHTISIPKNPVNVCVCVFYLHNPKIIRIDPNNPVTHNKYSGPPPPPPPLSPFNNPLIITINPLIQEFFGEEPEDADFSSSFSGTTTFTNNFYYYDYYNY